MRVAALGSSTPGTSAPKTVRGVRLIRLTPAQSSGTVPGDRDDEPGRRRRGTARRRGGDPPGLFVNARTDTHWLGDGDATDTFARLDAYQEAGADGVFVPGLTDLRQITALVRHTHAPLNILYSPAGPAVSHLADAGVRRISLGSLLYRRALGAALEAVAEIRAGRTPAGPTPSYEEVARQVAPR
ncbi:2-methylisocitrate lyase-like PEP mutase family enzyme [Streptomyces africanus]|uniref:2-methylisocitrate lyase-like PEP mutase family enzyme n=1 Tax=Streptomyces africanus TaxID=231024 RepID=A0ABU0QXY5_9ACTN|nr:2-methylisocitrate lyase-like PEP mutase family enzyme [Streptomyces africanus]